VVDRAVGVEVVARQPPPAGEGVGAEPPGLLEGAQPVQADGEVQRRAQGVGVVVAEDPPGPGEGVLAERAG
jgi:hypothetical protein